MKNTLNQALSTTFILLLLFSQMTVAAAPKPSPKLPPGLHCDFFLTHMPITFVTDGQHWRKSDKVPGDSGNIMSLEMGERGEQKDFVSFIVGSDRSKTVRSVPAASHLDMLLFEHTLLFQPSIINGRVFGKTNPVVRAIVERGEAEDSVQDSIFAGLTIRNDSLITKIESAYEQEGTHLKLQLNLPALDGNPAVTYVINLQDEASSLIFLAAQKLNLDRELTLLHNDYSVKAGSIAAPTHPVNLEDVIIIGNAGNTSMKIFGIEQYKPSPTSRGHTEFYVLHPANNEIVKLISRDYETGMKALELAMGVDAFKIKVTQYEALPGDNSNEVMVNRFEILEEK